MSEFQRYAVYYLPDDAALARFGASWLGWDVVAGTEVPQPEIPGYALASATATPRRYGFHGTLKPPFHLASGKSPGDLADAVAALAASLPPVRLDGLKLAGLGRFLALLPDGDTDALDRLAFRAVTVLDEFRAPLSDAELARRRAATLSSRQDALLLRWGYPFVAEEFRFHMTLSGKLEPEALDTLRDAASRHLPALPRPFMLSSISLVGERPDGLFQHIHRYALTGRSAVSAA